MSLDIWYSTKIPLNCSDHSITAHLLRIVDLFIQCVIKVEPNGFYISSFSYGQMREKV
ncbi:MAG: hypothetical protein K0S84_1658 [Nitrososphaera sp.]|nr:hypothetical protein [Nitrososphaera sp.]